MTQSTSTKPVHSVRYGNVRAAIWRNENDYHSVTFERSYRKDDQWKSTDSFGRDDLPKLIKVSDEAYSWIFSQAVSAEVSSE